MATTFFRINAGVSLKSAEIAAPVSLVESLGSESMVRLSVDAPWMGAGGPDAAGAIGNVRAVGRHSHFLPDHPGRRSRFHITQHSRQFARYLGGSHVRVKLTGAPARFNDLKNIHFREKQYAKANHAIGARDTH